MGIINVLSKQLANLIAAGEVVERPSSVVKELCENSLDAGATSVTVEIKGGGALYMRVTDNGIGMAPDDAVLAFSRHATSKLSNETQLSCIETMGFRGEALAAISAVSNIELLTRQQGSDEGVLINVSGGEISEPTEVGCPTGTTVIVKDLFFNTPARLKFLKKDATEAALIEGFVQKLAVARSEVAFELIKDGRTVLLTDGSGMKNAVSDVFGSALAADMLPIDYDYEGVQVGGFIGKAETARPSRKLQFFSVNGRVVRSLLFQRAMEEALKNSLMQGKYPICAINVTLPFSGVDVNVHPSKLEIKFSDERRLYDAVYFAVKNTFYADDTRPAFTLPGKKEYTLFSSDEIKSEQTVISSTDYSEWSFVKTEPVKEEKKEASDTELFAAQMAKFKEITAKKAEESTPVSSAPEKSVPQIKDEPVQMSEAKTQKREESVPDFRLVGEVFKTYIIAELEDEVLIIDKHAAKERMIFEKLKAQHRERFSQSLIAPVAVYLSNEEAQAVKDNMEFFSSLGFEIEDFGDGSLLLRGVPADINAADAEAMLIEAASKLLQGRRDATPDIYDEIMHSMACKAAIKGGQHSPDGDLYSLTKQLLALPDIKHCPHGRPVAMTLSKAQFESRFKR